MTPTYIVMTSSAHMPNSCWGKYRNVAVVLVEDAGIQPKMISEHARGVVRIIRHFGPQSVGTTARCAYKRTLAEANAMAESLNARAMLRPWAVPAKKAKAAPKEDWATAADRRIRERQEGQS